MVNGTLFVVLTELKNCIYIKKKEEERQKNLLLRMIRVSVFYKRNGAFKLVHYKFSELPRITRTLQRKKG